MQLTQKEPSKTVLTVSKHSQLCLNPEYKQKVARVLDMQPGTIKWRESKKDREKISKYALRLSPYL